MKKLFLIGVVLLLSCVGIYMLYDKKSMTVSSATSSGVVSKDAMVITMKDDEYTPSEIRIKKGQTVVFVNESKDWRWPASNLHPTHDIYPEFDPKEPVGPGKSWSFRFDTVGEWRMHDHLAPYITGTIYVKP